MNAITKIEQSQAAVQPPLSEAAALLSAIEKAALNPQVDIGKVDQLLALYERIEGRRAEAAFNEALTATQAAMRPVATDMENTQTHSRYASYAAIDRVLRPIYTNAGFSLTFNTAPGAPDAHVRVTCNVAHRSGHVRTYAIDLPADGKGAKGGDVMSRTHATASALSYGMRYLLRLIFNIAVGEGDDDGNNAGGAAISAEQLAQLRKLVAEAKADVVRFCQHMKVARLEVLPASRFQDAIAALEAKKAKAAELSAKAETASDYSKPLSPTELCREIEHAFGACVDQKALDQTWDAYEDDIGRMPRSMRAVAEGHYDFRKVELQREAV